MVLVKVALQPLAELEIVLVLCLLQLGHIDVPLTPVLVKGQLKKLVVVDKLILVLGSPLDLREVERIRVDSVHYLAVDSGCCALFNLGEVKG